MTAALLCFLLSVAAQGSSARPATPRVLVWGGDAEGGAPFVETDPRESGGMTFEELNIANHATVGRTCVFNDRAIIPRPPAKRTNITSVSNNDVAAK